MADDPKVDLTTDAADFRKFLADEDAGLRDKVEVEAEVRKIRREFLSAIVVALAGCSEATGEPSKMWGFAEDMLAEGQKRGHLP